MKIMNLCFKVCLLFWVLFISACSEEDKELQETLTVSKTLLNIGEEGGSNNISINSSHKWSIVCEEYWVKCSLTSGNGHKDVILTVSPNKKKEERQTKIVVKGMSKEVTVHIIQSGTVPTIQIGLTQKALDPSGEEFTVDVTANGLQWEVEVPKSAQSWLSLKEKSDKQVSFAARLNNNGKERTANLIFRETGKTDSQTIKVTQGIFKSTVADIAWSKLLSKVSDSWYETNEAKEVADNVLLYQRDCGGWHKNIEMHHLLTDTEKEKVTAEKKERGCFDNGATTMEMRFLAKMYKHIPDNRYRNAFVKGLNYIMNAQYPTGG